MDDCSRVTESQSKILVQPCDKVFVFDQTLVPRQSLEVFWRLPGLAWILSKYAWNDIDLLRGGAGTLPTNGQKRAQALFPKEEPSPDQPGDIDRKQCVSEERAADADVRGDGAAEITRQQDRAKN